MEALTATWHAGGDGSVLGWTMLHSLWQAGLVAAGLALVLRIVPSAMTRVRVAASSGALALVIVLAAGTWAGVHADWRQHSACWSSGEYVAEHPVACRSHGVRSAETAETRSRPKRRAVLPWSWSSCT